jgi:hypothetical protein
MMDNRNFQFSMSLTKSEGASDEDRLIRGLASAENIDAQGEVILQQGIDPQPALQRGYLNYDHLQGPENIIGVPLKIEIAEIQSHPIMAKSGLKGLGCFAEGRLFKGHPRADAVWSLLKSMEGSERSLAWSVQGGVLERGGNSNNMLTKTVIRHLAVTHQPVNQASFCELVKSLSTTNSAPLQLENLDAGNMPHQRYTNLIYGACLDSHFNKSSGRFNGGVKALLEHLIECKGGDIETSKHFIAGLIKVDPSFRSKF